MWYVWVALGVAVLVLFETWLTYRKLNMFDPQRREVMLKGISNAILFSLVWPSVLILLIYMGLSKLIYGKY